MELFCQIKVKLFQRSATLLPPFVLVRTQLSTPSIQSGWVTQHLLNAFCKTNSAQGTESIASQRIVCNASVARLTECEFLPTRLTFNEHGQISSPCLTADSGMHCKVSSLEHSINQKHSSEVYWTVTYQTSVWASWQTFFSHGKSSFSWENL